jgi:hypothetical protein
VTHPVFILQWANLIGPSLKKLKFWKLPKMQVSILNYRVPALWPNYIGERRATFAKAYGRKVRCYWELFGEHVRNLGANFDLTPQKTCMENRLSPVQVESGQSILHTNTTWQQTPTQTNKKGWPLHSMTWLLNACMEILFLKLASTIFGLDY